MVRGKRWGNGGGRLERIGCGEGKTNRKEYDGQEEDVEN